MSALVSALLAIDRAQETNQPRDASAFKVLRAALVEIAAQFVQAGPKEFPIPVAAREDAVQSVILRLLRNAAGVCAALQKGRDLSAQEAIARQYLRKMLGTGYVSATRRSRREERSETALERATSDAPAPFEEAQSLDRARSLLGQVVNEAANELSQAAQRDDLRRDFQQLYELVTEERAMDDEVAAEVRDRGGDPTQAQNRLFKRHERLRERLLKAIARLQGREALALADADLVRRLVTDWLLRRKPVRSGNPPVSPGTK